MKCLIVRETRGRMRVHLVQKTKEMSFRQADLIEHRLLEIPGVTRVKVFFRSGNVSVNFEGAQCREDLIDAFSHFDFEEYEENHLVPVNTGRIINAEYQDKLVMKVVTRSLRRLFLPFPVKMVLSTINATKYVWKALKSLKIPCKRIWEK